MPPRNNAGITRPNFVALCHELTATDEAVFEDSLPPPRDVGRLVAAVHDDRRGEPAGQPGGFPPQPRPRRGLQQRRADGVGRRLPDRRRPGRDRGPGASRRLPHRRLPRSTARRRPDRDVAAGADRQLRRPRRPPRRRALPAAVRHDGAHAAVRRRGSDRRPPAGRTRQGHRHRHGVHVRRRHRRHVVARARPADAQRHRSRRPLQRVDTGLDRQRRRREALRRARRTDRQAGPGARRSTRCASRAS